MQHNGPARAGESRVVAGVAGGLARSLAVDPLIVRLAFVVLVPADGLGVILYLLLWLGMRPPEAEPDDSAPAGNDPVRVAAFGAIVLGVVLLARAIGIWPGDAIFWPIAISFGALTLVFAPGVFRLFSQLQTEREERVRSQARAEMAAHLHDSVLQTLALIQRKADDPRQVVRLAREQERELRAWLLSGQQARDGVHTLGEVLEEVAASVERGHGVTVEVVRVRDCPMSSEVEPLVAAAREAMVNAARHSSADAVSVFLEVEPERATVFVRDRGSGFDRSSVGSDRQGLVESIEGRMARHGGRAIVRSSPGEGTEVELVLPRAVKERA